MKKYENISTDKIKSLLKASKENHAEILDEIQYSSYSFDRLKTLKDNKKIAADNVKELTEELKSRVGLFNL